MIHVYPIRLKIMVNLSIVQTCYYYFFNDSILYVSPRRVRYSAIICEMGTVGTKDNISYFA